MLIKLLRWALGIGIGAWGISSVRSTLATFSQFDADSALQFGFAGLALIIAAALIAPDLARLASGPLIVFVESLYVPSLRADKPPLTFRLGRYYAANGRLKDAETEYLRMLRFYPEATDGWIELMTLYWIWMPEDKKGDARRCYQRAEKKLSDSGERTRLTSAIESLNKGILPVNFKQLAAQDKARSQTAG